MFWKLLSRVGRKIGPAHLFKYKAALQAGVSYLGLKGCYYRGLAGNESPLLGQDGDE